MNLAMANIRAGVEAELFVWMAVHGHLLLALRHPLNAGASAQVVHDFCDHVGKLMVDAGLMTQAELDHTNQVEHEHRTRQMQ